MNIEAISSRPIAEWTLSDFEAVATSGVPESLKLEFKSDFELGVQEKWRIRQDQIFHPKAETRWPRNWSLLQMPLAGSLPSYLPSRLDGRAEWLRLGANLALAG